MNQAQRSMSWSSIYGELFVICFAIKLDWSSGVRVTELSVPALADPRDPLQLGCAFSLDGEELHSVKWYKDEQEFFRYTPRQQPHELAFPVSGVHLDEAAVACDEQRCGVRLSRLSTQHSGGVYKCEVSTEAPKFLVGSRAANVTVAAVGRWAPRVAGVRGGYAPGDLVLARCAAAPADPPPALAWLLNGAPAPPAALAPQRTAPPDPRGLVVAERELRLHADPTHFPLHLVCVARPPPGLPAAPTLTSDPVIARLLDPQPSTHQQQRDVKLVTSSSTDRSAKINLWLSPVTICLLLL